MKTRTYSELITINSFIERFEYLKLIGQVGFETFGSMRFLNQEFYRTQAWRNFRRDIIVRDLGCDLAWPSREVQSRTIVVHHINPVTKKMLISNSSLLLDPENVISCSNLTHKAIHYGDANLLNQLPAIFERKPNDTAPWRL